MKKYIIKCTKPKLIQTLSGPTKGQTIREEQRGYLKDYWYLGMEEYSYSLTDKLSEAKVFTFKEADTAKAILAWSSTAADIKMLTVETNIKLT